ncbi:MAG TPA: amino acid ABC transporter substrate-binding protein [Stellaceae bacterium]|jgi:branched-chain amino acid transport system substrate-binding protein|nr:amino acid ABC transporter substrate-binding protein [Stellaceae bacterium]
MQDRLRRLGLAFLAIALALAATPVRAADPLKIGFSMPLTGGLAGGGKSALLAIQMWAEDVNAKGGLLGRPVQLVFYDDQTNSSQVPAIYTKLLDIDKVDLVISAYGTNQIAPAMPIVMARNLVFMGLFGTGVNDHFHYDKYFQILPNGKETRLGPSEGFLEIAMTMNPKPETVALAAADAEYAQTVIAGAREIVKRLGLKVVYDKSYPPSTVDYAPIVRAIQAANPDVVYIASYPPDSVGMVRSANEVGLKPKMFGGGMIGLAFTPIKQQLGPLLNGIVAYDVYVPEPTMKFPGIEEFLKRYQEKAVAQGVDPLGYYLPPYAYAEMQIFAEAITNVGSLDQAKIAEYIHKTAFKTIVGDVKFAENGEWEKPRILFVQYQGVEGNDIGQFRQPGKQVILYPPELKSGEFRYPYSDIKR